MDINTINIISEEDKSACINAERTGLRITDDVVFALIGITLGLGVTKTGYLSSITQVFAFVFFYVCLIRAAQKSIFARWGVNAFISSIMISYYADQSVTKKELFTNNYYMIFVLFALICASATFIYIVIASMKDKRMSASVIILAVILIISAAVSIIGSNQEVILWVTAVSYILPPAVIVVYFVYSVLRPSRKKQPVH